MPIFELDEGRPRLVQPMQPLAGSFAQEAAALLTAPPRRDRRGAPVRGALPDRRRRTTRTCPTLLALDATGRSVVIDVGQVLDDDAIVSALRHAGAAARMTTTDLARAYHPDPSRFAVDFAAFREQAAYGAQSTRREGVRLILLCSEVAAEAGDTLVVPARARVGTSTCCRSASCAARTSAACWTCRRWPRTRAHAGPSNPPRCGSCGPARDSPGPTSLAPPRKPSSGELRSVTPPPPAPSDHHRADTDRPSRGAAGRARRRARRSRREPSTDERRSRAPAPDAGVAPRPGRTSRSACSRRRPRPRPRRRSRRTRRRRR